MHPILLKTPQFTIYSYGVCVAVAAALAWIGSQLLARRLNARRAGEPYPTEIATDYLFVLFVSGILGARLFYVLQHPGEYAGHWMTAFTLQEGGLVWYGGFIGALLCGLYYAKRRRLSIPSWADFFSPLIPLSHAVGRVGCFLNGCCFGKQGHPVQLYESALLVLLSLFLFFRLFVKKTDGEVFASYLVGYGTIRFVLEFLRADQSAWGLMLTLPQWISLASMAAGVWLLARPKRPDVHSS